MTLLFVVFNLRFFEKLRIIHYMKESISHSSKFCQIRKHVEHSVRSCAVETKAWKIALKIRETVRPPKMNRIVEMDHWIHKSFYAKCVYLTTIGCCSCTTTTNILHMESSVFYEWCMWCSLRSGKSILEIGRDVLIGAWGYHAPQYLKICKKVSQK